MTGLPEVLPGALDAILSHVNSDWARRVGGLLIGAETNGKTTVEAALPAETEVYGEEIAFTSGAWEAAYARKGPGRRIVGWYHSHPGGGVTLSDYDRRLHQTLFGEPACVVLVVDPLSERRAWFGWVIGELSTLESGVMAERHAPAQSAGIAGRRRPTRAAVVTAVSAIVAGAVGYWLGATGIPRIEPTSRPPAGRTIGRESEILRERLRTSQSQLASARDELRSMNAELEDTRHALERARAQLREASATLPLGTVVVRHRVQAGDTLWRLARVFYGSGFAWHRIYEANQARIPHPNRLRVGQELSIPIRLPG